MKRLTQAQRWCTELRQVTQRYGVKSMMGSARRSVFIIDPSGILRYRKEEPLSLSYRSVDDILLALRESGLTQ